MGGPSVSRQASISPAFFTTATNLKSVSPQNPIPLEKLLYTDELQADVSVGSSQGFDGVVGNNPNSVPQSEYDSVLTRASGAEKKVAHLNSLLGEAETEN